MGAEPRWTAPNVTPVITAAGHVPRQLRRALKTYPRNSTSSLTGAITHVSTALSSSSTVLWRVPSCSSSFSLPV